MFNKHKVRVVGFNIDENNSHPIMVAYEDGRWNFPYNINETIEYVVDESLIKNNDKGMWLSIQSLNKIEEELNLCEILKGCEGVELWSEICGKCKLRRVSNDVESPIEIIPLKGNGCDIVVFLSSFGKIHDYGECLLWPSETNRDWSTFKKPGRWIVVSECGKYKIPYQNFRLDLTEEELKELNIK